MMASLNETHDPSKKSWVSSANGHSDFPLQNLPVSVFRNKGTKEEWRGGIAIGDQILDLGKLAQHGQLSASASEAINAAAHSTLNWFMGLGATAWTAFRHELFQGLQEGSQHQEAWRDFLTPQAAVEFKLPAAVGDYTDFYTSVHHATTVGRLFRPDNPLLPNYKWVPIGYHGRASTLGVSGQSFHRPKGQLMPPGSNTPIYGPCKRLDYELELGIYMGPGNAIGQTISIEDADAHVFGLSLLNDWSARDVQAWEYQPLGPFLSKNFATTLSPWIVMNEALEPFRCAWSRDASDPQPLAYLDSLPNRNRGAYDINLEVLIGTSKSSLEPTSLNRVSKSTFSHAYWTVAQMVAHHASNGCSMAPGDLLGSGTQSGPTELEAGSLLELTKGGKSSIRLSNGEERTFLEDGDTVVFRGWCEKDGFARIGFGDVSGTVLPSL
jgi:fumarylacetoacetase